MIIQIVRLADREIDKKEESHQGNVGENKKAHFTFPIVIITVKRAECPSSYDLSSWKRISSNHLVSCPGYLPKVTLP